MSTADPAHPAGTKICPYCAEEIKEAAIKCRFCGSMLGARPGSGEWHRELDDKMVGGVCSGLARQFGISVTALRVAFAVATFIGGWGLLVYLVLWVIMPVRAAAANTPRLPAPEEVPPTTPSSSPSGSPAQAPSTPDEKSESSTDTDP